MTALSAALLYRCGYKRPISLAKIEPRAPDMLITAALCQPSDLLDEQPAALLSNGSNDCITISGLVVLVVNDLTMSSTVTSFSPFSIIINPSNIH